MFTAARFTIAEMSRQPKCPLADEWIKKMCFVNTYTHTHTHTHTLNGILLIPKKKDIVPFVTTCMELGSITLGELSQTGKNKDHGLTYMWNLKITSKKSPPQSHRYREQIGGCQRQGEAK